MLTKNERGQIRQLVQAPQWPTLERVAELKIASIVNEETVKDTEWETLQSVLMKEGRIKGIKELIKELINLSQYEQDE